MDSMKSLNTSLPKSYPRRQPPADLHQAFKAAALSVAQLYKTATADEDHSRAAGYQEALEELLSFLDQENLGVGDGEGWRVRQWVTERLSPDAYGSEEEEADNKLERAPTPKSRRNLEKRETTKPPEDDRTRSSSAPVPDLPSPSQVHEVHEMPPQMPAAERSGLFSFRSSLQPSEDAMMINNDKPSSRMSGSNNVRHFRSRSTFHPPREGTSASAVASLGLGAGSKRRAQSGDIFDFSIFDNIRDPNGGGKRGRFS